MSASYSAIVAKFVPDRPDIIAKAKIIEARELWCNKAHEWLENDGYFERAKKLRSEDDEERAAIEDADSTPIAGPRNFTQIYALEDMAEASLLRPERFPSEHWCARMILESDVPKWRDRARSEVSGLGAK